MPLSRVQLARIAVAGAGMVSVFVILLYLSYSKASGTPRFNGDFQQFADAPRFYDEDPRWLVKDRAEELKEALALSEKQYRDLIDLLERYKFGRASERWWANRDEFYAAFAEILSEEQVTRLGDWRQNRWESHGADRPRRRRGW